MPWATERVVDFCYGFSPIKRKRLQAFVGAPVAPLRPWMRKLPEQARVFVWGDARLPSCFAAIGVRAVRVEDGFVRSVGLGAAFAPPVSWTFDARGLHHWGHCASDLEVLLQTTAFSDEQRQQGQILMDAVLRHKISKYNLSTTKEWPALGRLHGHTGRQLLVIGQVADDAALKGISTATRTNMQLLAHARRMHPDAFIAYKRHPDVTAGLRRGDDGAALQWADTVMEGVSLTDALPWFDEVHVLNSLAGFEALIAGKPVVCHAQPFYAGWGLTQDLVPCARRTRKLQMSELVFAALALYPSYIHPSSGAPMDVFATIDLLAQLRQQPSPRGALPGMLLGRLYGFLRRLTLA